MMKHHSYLYELREKITDWFGLYFPDSRLGDLERGLIQAARELKLDESIEKIHQWIMSTEKSRNEIHVLASHLTVGETYFFRETIGLDLFKSMIVPRFQESIQNGAPLKIWCAGCSSGEEPYTLAILIKEYFPRMNGSDVSILASDINPLALKKAIRGIYSDWSFRTIDPVLKMKYFTRDGHHWKIDADIQRMVNFSFINLADQSYPSALTHTENLHVIFCRNVLMYFEPSVIKVISNRFWNCLADKGWLITSQVELNDQYYTDFSRVLFMNGVFYQKNAQKENKAESRVNQDFYIRTDEKSILRKDNIQAKKRENTAAKQAPVTSATKIHKSEPKSTTDLQALYNAGNYRQIIEFAENLNKHTISPPDTIYIISRAYANTGHYREAAFWLEKQTSGKHVPPEIFYLYATILIELNEFENAEIQLKKAIYLDHEHIPSYLLLGNLMNLQGKKPLASKYFKNVFILLDRYQDQEMVNGADGMTAGRIKSMIVNLIE